MSDVISMPLPEAPPRQSRAPLGITSIGRLVREEEIDALATSLVSIFSTAADGWAGHCQAEVIARVLAKMITAQSTGRPIMMRMQHANWAMDQIDQHVRRRAWEIIKAEEVRHG